MVLPEDHVLNDLEINDLIEDRFFNLPRGAVYRSGKAKVLLSKVKALVNPQKSIYKLTLYNPSNTDVYNRRPCMLKGFNDETRLKECMTGLYLTSGLKDIEHFSVTETKDNNKYYDLLASYGYRLEDSARIQVKGLRIHTDEACPHESIPGCICIPVSIDLTHKVNGITTIYPPDKCDVIVVLTPFMVCSPGSLGMRPAILAVSTSDKKAQYNTFKTTFLLHENGLLENEYLEAWDNVLKNAFNVI